KKRLVKIRVEYLREDRYDMEPLHLFSLPLLCSVCFLSDSLIARRRAWISTALEFWRGTFLCSGSAARKEGVCAAARASLGASTIGSASVSAGNSSFLIASLSS